MPAQQRQQRDPGLREKAKGRYLHVLFPLQNNRNCWKRKVKFVSGLFRGGLVWHYVRMREFRMVLCHQSRVSKMRLHKLYSLRNKSVTVLPAGSTSLIPISLAVLSPKQKHSWNKAFVWVTSSAAQGSGFIIGSPFSSWTSWSYSFVNSVALGGNLEIVMSDTLSKLSACFDYVIRCK